jgi:hypothetical protein
MPTERQDHPTASHGAFPYYFDGAPTGGGSSLTFPYSFPFAFQLVIPTFPYSFPISFSGTGGGTVMTPHFGFNFVDLIVIIPPEFEFKYDLAIFYGDLQNTYIDCRCSQWDTSDYSITIGTWVKKEDLLNLRNNIRPGAVKEFKRVIFAPKYYDSTWKGYNTIRLYPTPSSKEMNDSNLRNMRGETIMYVKNITEHPINKDWIEIKLEGNISGSSL